MTVKMFVGDHPEKNQHTCPLEHLYLDAFHDPVSSLLQNHHLLYDDFYHQYPLNLAVVVMEAMLNDGTNKKNTFHALAVVDFVIRHGECLHRTEFPLRYRRTASLELE
jgi:hypothetical protein